ncbi:hypothetical protein ACFL9T_10670 [Thermodesulfobacteriota bacterium]
MNDYICTGFGALQEGMFAFPVDISGQCAAQSATCMSLTTSDLEIHYLSQGEIGPFRTRAKIFRLTITALP